MRISLIVAVAKNGVIGDKNRMPWHLPADFAYFKKVTMGHPVVMGRKTFQSIGRPLPGRRNVVVSRNPGFNVSGVEVVSSLAEAIRFCEQQNENQETFIIGGATLYAEAMPVVDRIYLTEVDASPEGDIVFPILEKSLWREISREQRAPDEKNAFGMAFVVLERK